MTVKPLTQAEKKWIDQLQKILDSCPSKRLGAFTIGDADFSIYDKPVFDAYLGWMTQPVGTSFFLPVPSLARPTITSTTLKWLNALPVMATRPALLTPTA